MEKKDIEKYYQLSKKYFDNEEISKAIETLKIIEIRIIKKITKF